MALPVSRMELPLPSAQAAVPFSPAAVAPVTAP